MIKTQMSVMKALRRARLKPISCTLMRAGTSRGPFFDLRDLPEDEQKRNSMLVQAMGSGSKGQIDGLGGASSVTSKVAMVRPSTNKNCDIDFLFGQVAVNESYVDTNATCVNMLSGAAHYAIEKGWIPISSDKTKLSVFSLNNQTILDVTVDTPDGEVNYVDGDFEIAGVSGSGARVRVECDDISGAITGKRFPTGNRMDRVAGMDVSVVDVGNLLVLARATDFGLTGLERSPYFVENTAFHAKIKELRKEVVSMLGLELDENSVLPKVALLSPPQAEKGTIRSQYFTPKELHPTHSVSGAICVATATRLKGTVANEFLIDSEKQDEVVIEHQQGLLPIEISLEGEEVKKIVVFRTCRKLFEGTVYVTEVEA